MDNLEFVLLTDGSHLGGPHGKYQAGIAIVSPVSVLDNAPLPNVFSAQQAEFTAVTRVCRLAKQKLLIFTQATAFFLEWYMTLKQSRFLTSSGQPVKNGKQETEL